MPSVHENPAYQNDDLIRRYADKYDTPLYIFDEQNIRERCRDVVGAIPYKNLKVRYACKALTLQAILRIVREESLWIDASSFNEVQRCLRAGFMPSEIYYTGEGARLSVYEKLVSMDILINCTSMDQIRLLAQAGGTRCSLRVNPGDGTGESVKVITGGPSSKHGIYCDQIGEALDLAHSLGVKVIGMHSHIGSGTDLSQWLAINDITLNFARGLDDLEFINLGGGMPVVYNPDTDSPMPLKEWGVALAESMTAFSEELGRDIRLELEPGKFIVACSGVLLAQAQAVKSTTGDDGQDSQGGYNFVIVNTGLNHNIRPALYGSHHPIRFVSPTDNNEAPDDTKDYVVAGYLCESGDVLTVSEEGQLLPRPMPQVRVGDIMAMAGVGAYSHSMKSEYNSMNTPMSILVKPDGSTQIIERRGTLDDIMRREVEAEG